MNAICRNINRAILPLLLLVRRKHVTMTSRWIEITGFGHEDAPRDTSTSCLLYGNYKWGKKRRTLWFLTRTVRVLRPVLTCHVPLINESLKTFTPNWEELFSGNRFQFERVLLKRATAYSIYYCARWVRWIFNINIAGIIKPWNNLWVRSN